jgi:hypothetical protein
LGRIATVRVDRDAKDGWRPRRGESVGLAAAGDGRRNGDNEPESDVHRSIIAFS